MENIIGFTVSQNWGQVIEGPRKKYCSISGSLLGSSHFG